MNGMEKSVADLVIIACILGGIIILEFLAFGRHPAYKQREFLRRVMGIGTVLIMGGVVVYFARLHWPTYTTIAALFAVAGGSWWLVNKWENGRNTTLPGKKEYEQRKREWEQEKETA